MRIHLSANYAGYEAGRALETRLQQAGHDVHWLGSPVFDDNDDYPAMTIRVAQDVVADEDAAIYSRGIVLSGDGAGEVMAANKVNGARATIGLTAENVRAAREHADANVLVLPSDWLDATAIDALVGVFLDTSFSNGLDDARRLINTAEFETSGTIEGWAVDGDKVTEVPADPSNTGKYDSQRPGAAEAARAN